MTGALATVLAVMLLTGPDEVVDVKKAAAISADADRVETAEGPREPKARKSMRIRSVRSDFDRASGVVMFEGHAFVEYDEDCTMTSDRLFVFLSKTNELTRIVATGHVAITNDVRVGTCASAVYRRKTGEIEMFGDGEGAVARLKDAGEGGNEIEGSRIRFWLDSEQVEVENSRIRAQGGKGTVL